MNLSFNNTENAFAYKSDKELKKAKMLFNSMGQSWLVKIGTRVTPLVVRGKLPVVDKLIRNTIFRQFVGGETLEETKGVAEMLNRFNVQVILDYGVEGKESEADFEHACQQFIKNIQYAATQQNIPYISIKLTGMARFGLLQSLHESPRLRSGIHDNEVEMEEWNRVKDRMRRICEVARKHKIGVMLDAEETWIQDPIDRLAMEMMQEFNRERAVVYNTIQLYCTRGLEFLKLSHRIAREQGFILGEKLVRGAYMERERARALEHGYPSPIQPDKEATDRDYDAAVRYCIENVEEIALCLGSHNENSNFLGAQLMQDKGIPHNHPHVHFSQLYGMSDHITFNLAKEGFNVSKYLPFGPMKDVIPYLMRRAQENSSVSGASGKELSLIRMELERRKNGKS
ncbi:MAG TPA: proline dehydrogenase family protein [Chitinophagaceae bacterium]